MNNNLHAMSNTHWHMDTRRRSGIVLLIVLGILALMSLLAITFVQISRLERAISSNYVNKTRSTLVAESGIEYAIRRIRDFQGGALLPEEADDMAFKEGTDSTTLKDADHPSFQVPGYAYAVSGIVSGTHSFEGDYFVLKVEDESGKLNLNDSNGSWNMDDDADEDSDTDPDIINAFGRLEKTIEGLGDILFDVGAGVQIAKALFDPDTLGSRPNLGGRFSTMDQVRDVLINNVLDFDSNDFDVFEQHVTLWSWQDESVIRPTYQLTISVPAGQSVPPMSMLGKVRGVSDGGGVPGFDHDDVLDGYDSFHIYLFRDMQTKTYQLEPRCPVNVNTASPELLQTILTPLSGWYMEEGPASVQRISRYHNGSSSEENYWYKDETITNTSFYGNPVYSNATGYPDLFVPKPRENNQLYGYAKIANMPEDIAESLAVAMYERIHATDIDGILIAATTADVFETWAEFNKFLDGLTDDPIDNNPNAIVGFTRYLADLVRANCNPNSQLNDFNPDAHIHRFIDKAQLVSYTTEFCFEPTGTFKIESYGQVSDAEGELLAQSTIESVVKLMEIHRVSTQAEFMNGYTGTEDLPNYFSENSGSDFKSSGANTADSIFGYQLQCYPEPAVDGKSMPYGMPTVNSKYQTALGATAADIKNLSDWFEDRNFYDDSHYDGFLTLATLQGQRGDDNSSYCNNFNRTMKPDSDPVVSYYADYDTDNIKSLDASGSYTHSLGLADFDFMFDYTTNTDVFHSNTARIHRLTLGHSEFETDDPLYPFVTLPGSLYPDGAYSGRFRSLGFNAVEIGDDTNHRGMVGAVHFWLKPNFDVGHSNRPRMFFAMGQEEWWVRHGGRLNLFYFPNGDYDDESFESSHFYNVGVEYPMTPRNLVFGWNIGSGFGLFPNTTYVWHGMSLGSSTIAHRWHGKDTPAPGHNSLLNTFNVEGHEWSHIGMSWNLMSSVIGGMAQVTVNGLSVGTRQISKHDDVWEMPWPYLPFPTLHYREQFFSPMSPIFFPPSGHALENPAVPTPVFARFGGAPRMVTGSSGRKSDDICADSTYDEIFSFHKSLVAADLGAAFQSGRYQNNINPDASLEGELARYTSFPISLQQTLNSSQQKSLQLRSVSWTLYWPEQNRDANNANSYTPLEGRSVNDAYIDDPVLKDWDPILIDIAKNGTWQYDNNKNEMPTYAGGSRFLNATGDPHTIEYQTKDEFSFRVYFHMGNNDALYVAPVFDDITFVFDSSPQFLKWQIVH